MEIEEFNQRAHEKCCYNCANADELADLTERLTGKKKQQ